MMKTSKATHKPTYNTGFTLVELSVVLVVLALITGGVLVGNKAIQSAKRNAIISEHKEWATATAVFRERYSALPGDMSSATRYWGTADTSATDCLNADTADSTNSEATCNGNGDGLINVRGSNGDRNETFRFWQHLNNAGLVGGNFSGIPGPWNTEHILPGENVPRSKYKKGGWAVRFMGSSTGIPTFAGDGTNFAATDALGLTWGHTFVVSNANAPEYGLLLNPRDAWTIDNKIDDALPAKGKIRVNYWDDCTTATSQTDVDATYALDEASEDEECAMYFLTTLAP